MTLQEMKIGDLEILIVGSPIRIKKQGKGEANIIWNATHLLANELPLEKALSWENAVDALRDSPNYEWMIAKDRDDEPIGVAVYDTTLGIPKTGNRVNFGMVWYLVEDSSKRGSSKAMLDIVLQRHLAATQGTRTLGLFADDVPNCMDTYADSGFQRLPMGIYVPSLEDGKEGEIIGSVNLLFRPSQSYQDGIPAGYLKAIAGKYLWDGYASPSTKAPQIETMKAIEGSARNGLIVPLKN